MKFDNLIMELGIIKAVIICWPNVPKDAIQKMSLNDLCDVFQRVQDDPSKAELKEIVITRILKAHRNFSFWYNFSRDVWNTSANKLINRKISEKMEKSMKSFKDFGSIIGDSSHFNPRIVKKAVFNVVSLERELSFSDLQSLFHSIHYLKKYKVKEKQVLAKMLNAAKTFDDWLSIYSDSVIFKLNLEDLAMGKLFELCQGINTWLKIYNYLREMFGEDDELKSDRLWKMSFDKVTELAGNNFKTWLAVYNGAEDRYHRSSELREAARNKVVELASNVEQVIMLYNENLRRGSEFDYRKKMHQVINSFEDGIKLCESIDSGNGLLLERMLDFADTEEKLLQLYQLSHGELRNEVGSRIGKLVEL